MSFQRSFWFRVPLTGHCCHGEATINNAPTVPIIKKLFTDHSNAIVLSLFVLISNTHVEATSFPYSKRVRSVQETSKTSDFSGCEIGT